MDYHRLPLPTDSMPALFVGHGNPMNAISENEYTSGWRQTAESLPMPRAVLCISAHWETNGTMVTAMEKPRTIHDFGGFPRRLHEVEYPAPGDPVLARETAEIIHNAPVQLDHEWGLDHGTWSVLRHLFPQANIPVLQLSLDFHKPPQQHYELGNELAALRKKGVLIVGSGNVVHNLRMVDWNMRSGFDWALSANDRMKKLVEEHDHRQLVNYGALGNDVRLAVPTPEHYLPFLYILGLQEDGDAITVFNDKTELGSIAMTSFIVRRG
jgi:4,5-DOPA dioxygenase extradiol